MVVICSDCGVCVVVVGFGDMWSWYLVRVVFVVVAVCVVCVCVCVSVCVRCVVVVEFNLVVVDIKAHV